MFLTFFLALATYSISSPNKSVPVQVEVASTYEEKKMGLQKKVFLPQDQGMLFVFEKEGFYPFWMKNTPLKLSLIFINSQLLIVDIKEGKPFSKKIVKGGKPYQYVLEVNHFFIEKNQIEIGMHLEKLDPDNK